MRYSAGMTSKIFGFVESKKMAELMISGYSKEELTQIIEEQNLFSLRDAKRLRRTVNYVYERLTSLPEEALSIIASSDIETGTDVMKSRNLIAYFATESGEKISFDVPIMANSTDDEPEKRAFHEKFTLKSREYKFGDKYYMHISDVNDDKNILHSYEFMIDIAFVNDFGF